MVQETARDVADVIRSDIAEKIESGVLVAGHQLPTERELAMSYDTSRAVIRRGLDALEKDGWITRNVGRGTFVADRAVSQMPPANGLIDVSPADLAIARLMLEPSIAEYAAVHATASDLRTIQECLRKTEQAADALEFDRWDGELHAAIAAAAHNRFLSFVMGAVDEVRRSPGWTRVTVSTAIPARREIHSKDHRAIVEALMARDPVTAKEAMRRHIQKVIQFMLGATSAHDID
jgi:DNA-binding FadR family transcriptional regulator